MREVERVPLPDGRGSAGQGDWSGKLRRALRLGWTLLRELADENAYERHLAQHGRVHSQEEWRRFSAARLRAKYARARCC